MNQVKYKNYEPYTLKIQIQIQDLEDDDNLLLLNNILSMMHGLNGLKYST